jgi:hypothetical protein
MALGAAWCCTAPGRSARVPLEQFVLGNRRPPGPSTSWSRDSHPAAQRPRPLRLHQARRRRYLTISMTMVAVVLDAEPAQTRPCRRPRSAAARPQRAACRPSRPGCSAQRPTQIGARSFAPTTWRRWRPIDDLRASAAYRSMRP